MRGSGTGWLLVVTVALAGAVWLTRHAADEHTGRMRGERVFSADPEDVTELSLMSGDLTLRVVRKEREWFLDTPIRARADDLAVDRVLEALDAVVILDNVTDEQRAHRELSLTEYGLDKARITFRLVSHRGAELLHVGADTPLGGQLFARREGRGDVLVVGRDLLDIVPASAAVLRDRGLLRGTAEKAIRLEIQSAARGFIQLSRQDGVWVLQQPVAAPADQAVVTQLLRGAYEARIADFVWDPAVGDRDEGPAVAALAQHEALGLSEDVATLRVGVWSEDDRLGQELVFGRDVPTDPALVYARRRDAPSVYAVDRSLARLFDMQAEAFRDRRLFPVPADRVTGFTVAQGESKLVLERGTNGWVIREPVEWKADPEAVANALPQLLGLQAVFYRAVVASNLTEFGLAPPAYSLEVLVDGVAPRRLMLGPVTGGVDSVWGRQDRHDEVVGIRAAALGWLVGQGMDPLTYRDRTVLALAPETVWRISRRIGGSTQTVERVEGSSSWRVADGMSGVVDEQVIGRILAGVTALRALRIECRGTQSLATYGLDDTAVALTFGMRGDAGIQKTLLLGFMSRTDGIYGMVRGQDMVFVLGREAVASLTLDLAREVHASAPGAGGPAVRPAETGRVE